METQTKKPEIMREFVYKDTKFYLAKPFPSMMREAKFIYSKRFTESLKQGLYTKKRLEALLKEGDVDVLKAYSEKKIELMQLYVDTKNLIPKTELVEEVEYLSDLLNIYKQRLIEEEMSMNSLFANTADQMAEDDEVNFIAFSLIKKEDGNNVWDNLDAFLSDDNFEFVETCKYQVICWKYNINPDNLNLTKDEEIDKKLAEIRNKTLPLVAAPAEKINKNKTKKTKKSKESKKKKVNKTPEDKVPAEASQ